MTTPNETKIMNALNQLSTLTVEEMVVVNKGLCQMIRQSSQLTRVAAASKFNIGQIVKFNKSGRGRHAGTHYIKIENFNRAGTAVVGHPVDPKTGLKTSDYTRWTVSTTSCTLVA